MSRRKFNVIGPIKENNEITFNLDAFNSVRDCLGQWLKKYKGFITYEQGCLVVAIINSIEDFVDVLVNDENVTEIDTGKPENAESGNQSL